MATLAKLENQRKEIIDETYSRINEAEENRNKEYESVVNVQAWYRGTQTRAYLKFLHNCALAIQRRWRGYQGRKYIREVLKQKVFIMKLNHYNKLATKIQKVWRGYYVRKYVFNYYSRKKYLEGLVVKNAMVRAELEDYAEQQEMLRQIKEEEADKKRLDEWAAKNHHMRSTYVQPGIYNSPFLPYPKEQEFHLKNAKPRQQPKDKKATIFDPSCKRYDHPKIDPLPPIHQKPQGPFRDPQEVQQQRYKPFQPSLRVQTDYFSLDKARQAMKDEEWVTRLNDTTFQPFKTKYYPYEKLLHSTSSFGHLPYGTKFFRHEFPTKFVSDDDFKKVVPPIPVFQKLNDTYSQGQVGITDRQ